MKKTCLKLLVIVWIFLLFSCQEKKDSEQQQDKETAEQLVQQHCTSCHSVVSPNLADKDSWDKRILPAMAPKLGISVLRDNQYYQVAQPQIKPAISYTDWLKLVAYFKAMAPEKLDLVKAPIPLKNTWSIFSLHKPDSMPEPAMTTFVTINPDNRHIYTSSASTNKLYEWDSRLNSVHSTIFPSPITHAQFLNKETSIFTCIGSMLAVDIPNGSLVQGYSDKKNRIIIDTLFTGLLRPIHSSTADFNKDGLEDWVVCSFGHNAGGLYLFSQKADHSFAKSSIREVAGATQTVISDFNLDGWQDIMALFSSGDEGVWVFLNDHQGGFTSKNILRFPPIYGSTSFQLADFDQDGKQDILYTCGDNSDYSRILKPYHGIYIYLNQGNFQYKQTYFYPINGCTKAIATDFDLDGDLDIATIAFFGDLVNKPAETFIYFEQTTQLKFAPQAIPVSQYGRWICMDVNDVDADGDADIVLGNYSQGFINQDNVKQYWDKHLPFIVLENNRQKR